MKNNSEKTIDEALKAKIIKSVIFHFATCEFFDQLKLMDLQKTPQYQLSASDVEYLNKYQRYLDYMKANGIFSELGTPSTYTPDNVAKVPLRPFTFGVDDIVKVRQVVGTKTVKRTRTVEKKAFLWFKKKVKEEYEAEEEDIYYVPVIEDDVFDLCHDIVKKLTEIGYKNPEVSFWALSYSTYWGFSRYFSALARWDEIKNKKIDDERKCRFTGSEVQKVGDDLYEICENKFSGRSGVGYVTMEINADLENKSSSVLQYFHDIRSLAWNYYQKTYGEIVF